VRCRFRLLIDVGQQSVKSLVGLPITNSFLLEYLCEYLNEYHTRIVGTTRNTLIQAASVKEGVVGNVPSKPRGHVRGKKMIFNVICVIYI